MHFENKTRVVFPFRSRYFHGDKNTLQQRKHNAVAILIIAPKGVAPSIPSFARTSVARHPFFAKKRFYEYFTFSCAYSK